jgi:hypothetical protein
VWQDALTAAGWAVLRFTWDGYLRRGSYVLAAVGRHLAISPSRRGSQDRSSAA